MGFKGVAPLQRNILQMAVHPERASRSQVVEALLVAHLAADARLAQEDAYAKDIGRGGMVAGHALA